jgi:ADP-L-glycero-D-manno-heptose 6-epimerase
VDSALHFERPELAGVPFDRVVDRDALLGWLASERPALAGIVHLGACTDTTEMDVAYLERVNVDYSKGLWRYAARESLPFVYASSAATYGDGSQGYDDDEATIPRLVPLNPYGESKQRFDLFALAEAARGEAPPCWSGFKLFNVYGYGERHKGEMSSVVLKAFDQIRASGTLRLFRSHRPDVADGEQRRDFVAVEDVVEALRFAVSKPLARGIYNLGSGRARSFRELAHAVFAALGRSPRIEFIDMPEQLRSRYQYFTEARMQKLRASGWTHPATSLEQGVACTVRRLERA